ncbi:MAG TPA: aspartate aminotransferase family protein [Bacteroidales bacterium]|nr:aspartate aminotransferase family protein [Bacteroidales bacterium]HRT83604.1 aspartate aminotransferase family protein [Bacteroidales bacterium]
MKPFNVYKTWPVEPVKAKGCKVWDRDGIEYLDLYGGHAVISIGHAHPYYVKMLCEQMEKISFYSNSVQNSLQDELADKLGKISGYDDYSLFLCNSGAEANENALKLASFASGKKRVVSFKEAFHGRTSGAVAVTDNPNYVSPFNAGHEVTFVPINSVSAVENELSKGDVAAVIIEGIQGVAGIYEPDASFLKELSLLTRKFGAFLILDEVQSGYGRTGQFFAHQHSGIKPDIITTAKGMGNGFPIGGVIISSEIKPVPGMLGSTFGGNHLACTAAIAVLDVLQSESLIQNAAIVGEWLIASLKKIQADIPGKITSVRGRGLMIGIELDSKHTGVRDRLLFENHIFTGSSKSNIIRILPPLTISMEEAEYFLKSFTYQLNR